MSEVKNVEVMTSGGVSTNHSNDLFTYNEYEDYKKKIRVQWDYRDSKGKLHSGIARSLEDAKTCAAKHGFKE